MPDTCPNILYPVVGNEIVEDPSVTEVCGFDLTEARQVAADAGVEFVRCPQCGRKL